MRCTYHQQKRILQKTEQLKLKVSESLVLLLLTDLQSVLSSKCACVCARASVCERRDARGCRQEEVQLIREKVSLSSRPSFSLPPLGLYPSTSLLYPILGSIVSMWVCNRLLQDGPWVSDSMSTDILNLLPTYGKQTNGNLFIHILC